MNPLHGLHFVGEEIFGMILKNPFDFYVGAR
jgi:hypothetical protein